MNLPPVKTMSEARDAYVAYLKRFIEFELKEMGKGPLLNVDSSLVFKYLVQAGIDVLGLEVMPGDPHLMHAAIRGAARAYNKSWGAHIAMMCYGGVYFDELWQKRWKTALYYSYISGAKFMWPESGHYTYDQNRGQIFAFHSKEMKRVRRTLREIYQFACIHTRPNGAPKVALGVVHGNLDGAPGLWNKYVWGQFKGKKWLAGPAEKGWELVNKFHRKEEWSNSYVQGETDFSGNPPYGQYDVVPIEAPLGVLKSYRCLLFLGWNTMTAEIYETLKKYVQAGGHLVMYVPHLSTHTDRARDLKLFRNGDFSDLFGVKVLGKGKPNVMGVKCFADSSLSAYRFPRWRFNTDPRFIGEITPARVKATSARILSGYDDYYHTTTEKLARRPILVENSLGKGKAFLVTVWQYPGDEGIRLFTEDLLRTILAGEQGHIRLLSSDRVRYAVYDGALPGSRRKYSVVYLLNTDPDCPAATRLWLNGRTTKPFEIPANDLRIAYCFGNLALIPEDRRVDLAAWKTRKNRHDVGFFNVRKQSIEVHNVGNSHQILMMNGVKCSCEPRERKVIGIGNNVDRSREEFFATGFGAEHFIHYKKGEMPY
ncbi:MAG: hypothetical protein HY360_21225 [Verrucomicrobia bacterium]|nr:hypothetical protein [Verrucomicrobiota bacterium]